MNFVNKYGDKIWKNKKGRFHRENGPAIEAVNGAKKWFVNGLYHREDGPAIEYADGDKEWYFNGLRHRIDGPAIEGDDGSKVWYIYDYDIDDIQCLLNIMERSFA